ncbi:ferritin-like domain-containing protein [Cytophagaceae bacterium ABcell3]|nr:ferritin-like domain-containing protein [Cytophagaceae bacterium ABcell3]
MENNKEIIQALQKAYWKEIETIMNYQAHSINLDGIRAEEIKEILSEEVSDELGHSRKLAERIKELDGTVEGSASFKAEQHTSQPPQDTTDLKKVIQGVIDAESDAIKTYQNIIKLTDGTDYVTQDLCIELLADEEKHLRVFKGFMKGIEKQSGALA